MGTATCSRSRSERPESVPANRGEPAPADGIACRTDHEPVAAEQPRCLGACTNNACLRLHASPLSLRKDGERNRRLRVARFGEGNKVCTGSHGCCFVATGAPEAANRTGNNLPAWTLTKRHNTDGKPREKRCRRIRQKWSASDQETWEPAQELERHQNPHLPPSDLLDGRVDDIDGCRHPRLVNLTDVGPRHQMVEQRLRTTHMHCLLSHCRGVERMIVFPLIRSVGLKAATASSRAATVPMFDRNRPSRTRRAISLIWPRSEMTTKSIARPSAGHASGGPVTVTSVPPARTTPADRFWMSPPRTSNTRSTPPTASRVSLSRSTNSCAPKSSAVCRPAPRPVPMTCAPASRASWVAIEPTAPAAPCTRTLWPAWNWPRSGRPCLACTIVLATGALSVE